MNAVEGRVPFLEHETWYRVVGEDTPGRLPLVCLHGGPGSTHHYFEPLSSTLCDAAQWAEEAARLLDELPVEQRALLAAADRSAPGFAEAEDAFDRRYFHRLDPPHPAVIRGLAAKSRRPYEAMWGPNEWTVTGRLPGWNVCGRLGAIRSPTLVLSGRYDLCTPPVVARLVEGIAGAKHVVFEHSSHTPVAEESERYLQVVADFLARVERHA